MPNPLCLVTLSCDSTSLSSAAGYGQWGDYFGGFYETLISLATVFFLWLTYWNQRKSNRRLIETTHFYELVKNHLEIVKEINFQVGQKQVTGREVFRFLMSEWSEIFKLLKSNNFLSEDECINLSYTFFFFGTHDNAKNALTGVSIEKVDKAHQLIADAKAQSGDKKFRGHTYRLGHYFRNLYNCYLSLDGFSFNRKQKYQFGKSLPAGSAKHS
jgi:hypothetical protein